MCSGFPLTYSAFASWCYFRLGIQPFYSVLCLPGDGIGPKVADAIFFGDPVEDAVTEAIRDTDGTPDLGGTAGTRDLARAVVTAIGVTEER